MTFTATPVIVTVCPVGHNVYLISHFYPVCLFLAARNKRRFTKALDLCEMSQLTRGGESMGESRRERVKVTKTVNFIDFYVITIKAAVFLSVLIKLTVVYFVRRV